MFDKTDKERLGRVQNVLAHYEGGIYKRIDENRELAELLKREAPQLIELHPYIWDWLKSQDVFLRCLEAHAAGSFIAHFSKTESFPRENPFQATNFWTA